MLPESWDIHIRSCPVLTCQEYVTGGHVIFDGREYLFSDESLCPTGESQIREVSSSDSSCYTSKKAKYIIPDMIENIDTIV